MRTAPTESILTKLFPLPPFVFSVDPPSMVMLFPFDLFPATLYEAPPEKPCTSAVPGLSTTPGSRATSVAKSRFITVRFSISFAVMMPERSPPAICTVADSAATVMDSVTSPTSMRIELVTWVSLGSSSMLVRW